MSFQQEEKSGPAKKFTYAQMVQRSKPAEEGGKPDDCIVSTTTSDSGHSNHIGTKDQPISNTAATSSSATTNGTAPPRNTLREQQASTQRSPTHARKELEFRDVRYGNRRPLKENRDKRDGDRFYPRDGERYHDRYNREDRYSRDNDRYDRYQRDNNNERYPRDNERFPRDGDRYSRDGDRAPREGGRYHDSNRMDRFRDRRRPADSEYSRNQRD